LGEDGGGWWWGGVQGVRTGEVAPAVRRSSHARSSSLCRGPLGRGEGTAPGTAAAHAGEHRAKLRTSSIASFSSMNFLLINVCTTALCTSPYAPLAIFVAGNV
jgi:hypothetical protein